MVLQKRLDHESSGYHLPPMPRFPVSARGKRSIRKKHEDNQISAFDLLATVAGELLSEKENSVSEHIVVNDSIKKEQQDDEIPSKAEVFDQGSCNESTLGSEILLSKQPQILKSLNGESGELVLGGKRKEFGCSLPPDSKKICTVVGVKTPLQAERRMAVNAVDGNSPEVLEDPMYLDANKPPALVSSDSSVEVPIYRTGSFPILPVNRDDDENSSGCTHPRNRPQRIGDRRIRKLLASKFWKVPQRTSQNGEISNADVEMRSVFRSRKMCYTRERTQRSSFKRKKLFERRSISEAVCNSLKLGGIKMEASGAHASSNGVNGPSSLTSGQKSSYESGDYHVKLSIKSFKVPELFIEIPETATIGSLKRTVMEAVTAILSGGLRVGVLLQGKKVRDDKQTLLQAGISHSNRMDNLGFTLESNSTQTPPPLPCTEDPNPLLPINAVLPCPPPMELVRRIPVADPVVVQVPPQTAPEPPQSLNLNSHESDHDSVQSPTSSLLLDKGEDSKAVVPVPVPVPAANADTSAVVPLRNKSKRSDLAQRRIRRPFSVTEVEALVQAVEKLGTGRWRDVKIGAFDNAKHRTYVDLKDKWKTLVHTARISPQQRRGEPVPQELLDRVLSAHAYWTQQQSKPTHSEVCLI